MVNDIRPLARQTWGPHPEAWFPWSGAQGRPRLFGDDEVRIKHLNGVYSNRFKVCERGWADNGEWEIVAIGVMLENLETLARMEALTGYRALRAETPETELERVKAERDYHQQHNVTLGICVDKLSARAEAAEARLAEAEQVLRRVAVAQRPHLAGHYARNFLTKTKEPSHAD